MEPLKDYGFLLSQDDLEELSEMRICNEDYMFDAIMFGEIVMATMQGIDLEETSFQTALSKEMKGKLTHFADLTDEEMWKVCLEGGHVDCIADVDWEIDGMEELKHQYLRLCKAILRKAQ